MSIIIAVSFKNIHQQITKILPFKFPVLFKRSSQQKLRQNGNQFHFFISHVYHSRP